MLRLTTFMTYIVFIAALLLFVQCESDSCTGEAPKVKVETNNAGSSRVRVTFSHQGTGQIFQFVDITENNSKNTGPLPPGRYSIHADISKSTGTYTIRLSAQFKDCIDYTVFVNSTSLSMILNGEAR